VLETSARSGAGLDALLAALGLATTSAEAPITSAETSAAARPAGAPALVP
jgi:hypothetical protein